jgi:hypothetical protein
MPTSNTTAAADQPALFGFQRFQLFQQTFMRQASAAL